jgi:hypothetical protein
MEARTMTTTREKADIVDRLNDIWSDDGHKRGCQGRTYSCSCGLDDRTRGTAIDAAAEIASLRRELDEAREALAAARHWIYRDEVPDFARNFETLDHVPDGEGKRLLEMLDAALNDIEGGAG